MFSSNQSGNQQGSHKDPAVGEREALSTLFFAIALACAAQFNRLKHFY